MSEQLALSWSVHLIAVAVSLQTVELLLLRRSFADDGIWRWDLLRDEFACFPSPLRTLFELTLPYKNFVVLLYARLVAALLLPVLPHPALVVFLFFASLLVCLRWRGVFNGGSDYMTLVVLSALSVAALFPHSPIVAIGCLWYIALQSCASYFIAGVVKAGRASWRNGTALHTFLLSTIYQSSASLQRVTQSRARVRALSLGLIAFELAFPLGLFDPTLCAAVLAVAVAFHLLNVYVFGLNRFFFAWLASYPAVLYASHFLAEL